MTIHEEREPLERRGGGGPGPAPAEQVQGDLHHGGQGQERLRGRERCVMTLNDDGLDKLSRAGVRDAVPGHATDPPACPQAAAGV